jgi:hypothetical protein
MVEGPSNSHWLGVPWGSSLYGADEMLALAAARQEWYIIGCPSLSTKGSDHAWSRTPAWRNRNHVEGLAVGWNLGYIMAVRKFVPKHPRQSIAWNYTPASWRASPMSAISRDCFTAIPFRVLLN